jgi:hypothetical protein
MLVELLSHFKVLLVQIFKLVTHREGIISSTDVLTLELTHVQTNSAFLVAVKLVTCPMVNMSQF